MKHLNHFDKANGKPVFWRLAKTVLNDKATEFGEKMLCDSITLNTGDLCAFSCTWCYAAAAMLKLNHEPITEYNKQNGTALGPSDVIVRRVDAVEILKKQLSERRFASLKSGDNRVCYSSTLVDVAANKDLLQETSEWVTEVLETTFWQVRLLSKSALLKNLVELVPDRKKDGSRFSHHQRIIFGFSTGTLDDKLAASFERGTSSVTARLRSLYWLQDNGFRTFGMACPSLPQENYDHFAREMVQALRIEKLEHLWAEVINVRGASFKKTKEALLAKGFDVEAERLASVSDGTKQGVQNWEYYARATFDAYCKYVEPQKLRFLQYVHPGSMDWWVDRRKNGAVLLGNAARVAGLCSHDHRSAPNRYYSINDIY